MSAAAALQIIHLIRLSPQPGRGSCSRRCEHSSWVATQMYLEEGIEEERKRFYGSFLYVYLLYLVAVGSLKDSFGPQTSRGQPKQMILRPFVLHEPDVPVKLLVHLRPRIHLLILFHPSAAPTPSLGLLRSSSSFKTPTLMSSPFLNL